MSRVIPVQSVSASAKIFTTVGGSSEDPDRVIIQNNSSDATLYINIVPKDTVGGAASASHFPIPFGGSIELQSVNPEDIWAFSSGTCPVSVLARR